MRALYVAMTAALLASCGGGGGTATTFQPGQWEMTSQVLSVNVPNMPQGTQMPLPPPQTMRTCMTEAQATAPSADFLAASGENGGCTSNNMSFANGRIGGTVQCNQQGVNMEMTLTGEYTPTSMEMNQQIRTQQAGMNMQMEARTTGRRVGDCPTT